MDNLAVLKAISDDTRASIIDLLITRSYCGRALSCKLGISEAAVSQHLKILKNAGLLKSDKKGYFVHYTVNRAALEELADGLYKLIGTPTRVSCMVEPCDCKQKGTQKCRCMDKKKDVKKCACGVKIAE